jgi:hypothetical protein
VTTTSDAHAMYTDMSIFVQVLTLASIVLPVPAGPTNSTPLLRDTSSEQQNAHHVEDSV